MTMPSRESLCAPGRRRPDSATMARISPLPPPEEVFFDWLASVPPQDCLEAAARTQIEVIDRSDLALHPDVSRLRMMLVAVAGRCDWRKPSSNF